MACHRWRLLRHAPNTLPDLRDFALIVGVRRRRRVKQEGKLRVATMLLANQRLKSVALPRLPLRCLLNGLDVIRREALGRFQHACAARKAQQQARAVTRRTSGTEKVVPRRPAGALTLATSSPARRAHQIR